MRLATLLNYWERIRLSRVPLLALGIFFLAYIGWELYCYLTVGLQFIKWHTHLLFPISVYLAIRLLLNGLGCGRKSIENVSVIFIGLFLTELILVCTGWTKTHSEKLYDVYVSPNNTFKSFRNYYWIDDPHSTKHLRDKEFYYTRTTNALGYSDSEWPISKKPNEYRILCIGDSFTEGDGAHADSSYVSFLRRKLALEQRPITVMNAGKCGSDPFFNFVNYRDLLTQFCPDLVIQTISRHDLADDIVLRGGMDRFGKDYALSFQKKPSATTEFIYATSYTSRIFFRVLGYNELLINTKRFSQGLPKVAEITSELFSDYANLVKANRSQILVVLLPNKYEIEQPYEPFFATLIHNLSAQDINTCDLRDYYMNHMDDIDRYYWVDNGHHNARGYELMSDGILDAIHQHGFLKDSTSCAE